MPDGDHASLGNGALSGCYRAGPAYHERTRVSLFLSIAFVMESSGLSDLLSFFEQGEMALF